MKSTLLALAVTAVSGSILRRAQEPCPFHTSEDHAVPNHYVVKFKEGHTLEEHFAKIGKDLRESGDLLRELSIINGYYAQLENAMVHELIRYDPMVEYVEQNRYLYTPYAPSEDHTPYIPSEEPPKWEHTDLRARGKLDPRKTSKFVVTDELSEFWHSQITAGHTINPLNRNLEPRAYTFEGAGKGVDIYILDTGVRLSHSMFQGRASNFGNRPDSKYTDGPADDNDSHGTHVASIAAKVAPNANIINVKVSCRREIEDDPTTKEPDCQSHTLSHIFALDDIALEHDQKKRSPPPGFRGSVINISYMSGTDQPSQAYKDAIVKVAKEKGIPVAVGAGNNNTSAVRAPCQYNTNVICVGAVTRSYTKVSFSSYGKRLGIHAPGDLILGASSASDNATMLKSGTSQATPMVAGTMALYVGWEGLNSNVNAVYERLRKNALPNVAKGFDDQTVTLFLNTGINNPDKDPRVPYLGAPVSFSFDVPDHTELKAVLVDDDSAAAADPPASPAAATTGGDDDELPAPTGDPNATGTDPLPASDIEVIPKGYASIGFASAADSSLPATITLSWTAPISSPTDDSTENTSVFEGILTIDDPKETPSTSSFPLTTSSSEPSEPEKTPDVDSEVCRNCRNSLKPSDCKADDPGCLTYYCWDDPNCSRCGRPCDTLERAI